MPFNLNVGGSSTDTIAVIAAVQAQLALGQQSCRNDNTAGTDCNESDGFWIVYLQMAYQHTTNQDHDPDVEAATSGFTHAFLGLIDDVPRDCSGVPVGGTGSLIYLETARDHDRSQSPGQTLIRERTAPHEVGHQFGLKGDTQFGLGVMSLLSHEPIQFHPRHLHVIRCRVKSPGRGPGDP